MKPSTRHLVIRSGKQIALWTVILGTVTVAIESFVGIDQVLEKIAATPPQYLFLISATVCCGLFFRGVGLWVIFGIIEIQTSIWRAVTAVPVITFFNRVAPSGQLGGTPINGWVVTRINNDDYETALVGVMSAIALNNAIIVILGILGAILLAFLGVGETSSRIILIGLALLLTSVGLGLVVYMKPDKATIFLNHGLNSILSLVTKPIPRVSPANFKIQERLMRFREALSRISHSREKLALVLGIQTTGRIVRVTGFWIAFHAVGIDIGLLLLFVVLPVSMLTAVIPLPTGGGGVDAMLATLLVSLTTFNPATIIAGILLFRVLDIAVVFSAAAVGGITIFR